MATTTILLREDIDTLGGRGEIVKVKAGYARNYLLPQGLATLATKGNLKQIESAKEQWAMDTKAATTATPAMTDLTPNYVKSTPLCPSSGTYTIGAMSASPTCSIGGTAGQYNAHVLP